MVYQIALADDQPLARQCVKRILADSKDYEVVAEADDGNALCELIESRAIPIDLVIVDISMPKMEGIEIIRRIKQFNPDIQALVLTVHDERDYLARALLVGAAGYLVKGDADEELAGAIDKIRKGGTYISTSLKD